MSDRSKALVWQFAELDHFVDEHDWVCMDNSPILNWFFYELFFDFRQCLSWQGSDALVNIRSGKGCLLCLVLLAANALQINHNLIGHFLDHLILHLVPPWGSKCGGLPSSLSGSAPAIFEPPVNWLYNLWYCSDSSIHMEYNPTFKLELSKILNK